MFLFLWLVLRGSYHKSGVGVGNNIYRGEGISELVKGFGLRQGI